MKRVTWDIATQGPPPASMFAKKGRASNRIRGLSGPKMTKPEQAWGHELELSRLSTKAGHNITALAITGVLAWAFESVKLRLANGTFYTPDFLVNVERCPMHLQLHEVKGPHAEEDAKIKFKMAAAKFHAFYVFCYITQSGGRWNVEHYVPSDSDRVS